MSDHEEQAKAVLELLVERHPDMAQVIKDLGDEIIWSTIEPLMSKAKLLAEQQELEALRLPGARERIEALKPGLGNVFEQYVDAETELNERMLGIHNNLGMDGAGKFGLQMILPRGTNVDAFYQSIADCVDEVCRVVIETPVATADPEGSVG